MGKNIISTRCLFISELIRSNIDFLYVKGKRLSAHKLPIILPPPYYLTYNVTFPQLVSGCLGSESELNSLIRKINLTSRAYEIEINIIKT